MKPGSSPLARGLRRALLGVGDADRIIPARAGFTSGRPTPSGRLWDHPRSRGVYSSRRLARWRPAGSSPLARGLPGGPVGASRWLGIIPARAGFTATFPGRGPREPDHPRSRGVYPKCMTGIRTFPGSSPLARGLRSRRRSKSQDWRIIPARAGFTRARSREGPAHPDHPRSRGVYRTCHDDEVHAEGSSPLARGLLGRHRGTQKRHGIIPARAGFTAVTRSWAASLADHPRSRGVYRRPIFLFGAFAGSSPLARGLHVMSKIYDGEPGIIPARAGFTSQQPRSGHREPDHPRSRGVYTCGSLESQRRATLPDRVCLHCRPSARSAEFR